MSDESAPVIELIRDNMSLRFKYLSFHVVPATSGLNVLIPGSCTLPLEREDAEGLRDWLTRLYGPVATKALEAPK